MMMQKTIIPTLMLGVIILAAGGPTTVTADTAITSDIPAPITGEAKPKSTKVFSDIDVGSNYFVQLSYLKEKGLIKGYDDGSFKPKNPINRAEAAMAIQKALLDFDLTPKTTPDKNYYTDIPENYWAIQGIRTLTQYAVVSGYEKKNTTGETEKEFRPEKTINLAEAAKMIIEVEMLRPRSGITLPTDEKSDFYDVEGTEWFAPYVAVAKQKTLLSYSTKMLIHPNDEMTRGAFADLLYRTIKTREPGHFFGRGTFYSDFFEGRGTSSGEKFTQHGYTAANKELPFNTKLHVTYLRNGQGVDVRVNDRGPFTPSLSLDMTSKAFAEIANPSEGIIPIEYDIIPTSPAS